MIAQVLRHVHVLLAVGADDEILARFEAQPTEDVGGLDPWPLMLEDLEHRAAGLDDEIGP